MNNVDAQRRADVQWAVSEVLAETRTADEAFPALLAAVAGALRWQYAGIWIVEGDQLRCANVWSDPDPKVAEFARASHHSRFRRGEGLPGRSWKEGTAIWLSSIQRDPTIPRAPLARKAGLYGGLAFPLAHAGGIVGVLECFTRAPDDVTPDMLRLAEAIGRQIGQFLYRRAIEEELEDNEARYAAIVNGTLDAIVVIDANGAIVEFNPAAERLFQFSRADVLGREMAELIVPPSFREAHRAGLHRHQQSGQSTLLERRIELSACRSDGTEFPVELTISRMRVHGQWHFLGFLRDITERKAYEREREELIAREREAHDQMVSANALKDEFLAALSHELRTPLNALMGWSQMLADGAVEPGRVQQVAATVLRNAAIQQRLVEDMLDLSAFVQGRMHMATDPVVITEPVQAAWDVVKPMADAKAIALFVDLPAESVRGDKTRLQQVFWNLLTNAIKFSAPAGRVWISGTSDDHHVTITVRDAGRGIDRDFLPYVFDRFRQGPGTQRQGGVGLGLAIAKQIVEAHGGSVAAESEGDGRGAAFTVRLPRERI